MSGATTRIPLADAQQTARRFCDQIADCTAQLTVAGSIRRRLTTVGDVEIVAVPKIEPMLERDMFGEIVATHQVDLLDARLTTLLDNDIVTKRLRSDGKAVWGQKMRYLTFEGVPVDLFTPDADRWGIVLAIRTGPRQFSKQLVSGKGRMVVVGYDEQAGAIKREGLLPAMYRVQDGWLRYRVSGQCIRTPTEEGFFERIGLKWRDPWERR